jgi:DNA-binding response OmpR family regulator
VPGLSAFELTRRLRALGVEAPVVLLTGWVRDVDPAAAREVGIDLILAKPISAEDLAGSLRSFGVRER